MSDGTKIEWATASWNPVKGCSRASEGCERCYAERFAGRRLPGYDGLVEGGRWTGEVRFDESVLDQPLRWRKPRRVFVCSMSDLFHPRVTNEALVRIHDAMERAPQHQYLVLTKRPARMRAWYERRQAATPRASIWCGVSVENQKRADDRIPDLLATPAAVRWVSAEPLLGRVDLTQVWERPTACFSALKGTCGDYDGSGALPALDWVVIGGETSPGARPCDVRWVRDLVGQCAAAGVPAFLKQLGTQSVLHDCYDVSEARFRDLDANGWTEHDGPPRLAHRKGADPAEWPEELRVREYPRERSAG